MPQKLIILNGKKPVKVYKKNMIKLVTKGIYLK